VYSSAVDTFDFMMLLFLVYAKQREKVLEKQLHSLIEQLASKQVCSTFFPFLSECW
jgi:hypothetical protein